MYDFNGTIFNYSSKLYFLIYNLLFYLSIAVYLINCNLRVIILYAFFILYIFIYLGREKGAGRRGSKFCENKNKNISDIFQLQPINLSQEISH